MGQSASDRLGHHRWNFGRGYPVRLFRDGGDYVRGDGGADTFVYDAGYGSLEIDADAGFWVNTAAVLKLGASISAARVKASSDASGNLYFTHGTPDDRIKIDAMMNSGYAGYAQYGVQQVSFADGTTRSRQQLFTLATTGTAGADTFIGGKGNDRFNSGAGSTPTSTLRATATTTSTTSRV